MATTALMLLSRVDVALQLRVLYLGSWPVCNRRRSPAPMGGSVAIQAFTIGALAMHPMSPSEMCATS